MLTIKQITENTEAVIRGLEKKHFKNAKETIDQVYLHYVPWFMPPHCILPGSVRFFSRYQDKF